MPDSLSLVWGHSVHFAKFTIPRFSKRHLSNNFHRIRFKLYENIAYQGVMQDITLLGNWPSFTKFMALWKFEHWSQWEFKPKMWNISKTAVCRTKRSLDGRAKGKLWHFDFFLNTGPYAAGNFKVPCLPQFSLEPSKLYGNMRYHGKSKCPLEYSNEKLASST